MTKNQIEYSKLLETHRTNLRNEELTASRDMEVARHNLAGEGLQRMSLDEVARANRARETETARSNRVNEQLASMRDQEAARANRAREYQNLLGYQETVRSNLANERYRRDYLSLQSRTLDETMRTNRARENLTAKELGLKRDQLGYNYAALAETARSNQARETETNRSNLARELETQRSNLAREVELQRSNLARETETERHNRTSEKVDIGRAATYAADVAGRLIYYNKDRNVVVNNSPVQVAPSKQNGSGNTGNTDVSHPNPPNINGGNVYVQTTNSWKGFTPWQGTYGGGVSRSGSRR